MHLSADRAKRAVRRPTPLRGNTRTLFTNVKQVYMLNGVRMIELCDLLVRVVGTMALLLMFICIGFIAIFATYKIISGIMNDEM